MSNLLFNMAVMRAFTDPTAIKNGARRFKNEDTSKRKKARKEKARILTLMREEELKGRNKK